jgi:RES domain-containing protein
MIVYHLAMPEYANDISGEGASVYGGRWNPVGIKGLYASQSISLCILEILVRTQKKINPPNYQLITLEIPGTSIIKIKLSQLKTGWKQHIEYTQWIGGEFLKDNKSLTMQVPSAIIERENNFLINPSHKDFKGVKLTRIEMLDLDRRISQI